MLRGYVRRRRLLLLGRSFGAAVFFFLVFAVTASLLDRLFVFSRAVRVTAFSFDLFVVLFVLLRSLATMPRKFDPVQAAIAMENQTPIFDQRLVTVVSHKGDGPLIEQLRCEVEALAGQPASRPTVSLRPLLRPWTGVALIMLLIAALWPWHRLDMPTHLSRFFHPRQAR